MNKKQHLTSLPYFLEIQRNSFCWFLLHGIRSNFSTSLLTDGGLDFNQLLETKSDGFIFEEPTPKMWDELSIEKLKLKSQTYEIKLSAVIEYSLSEKETNYTLGFGHTKRITLGRIPLLTERGSFIIRGCERILISQIIRKSGVYFKGYPPTEAYAKLRRVRNLPLIVATIIPKSGRWLHFYVGREYMSEIEVTVDHKSFLSCRPFMELIKSDGDKKKEEYILENSWDIEDDLERLLDIFINPENSIVIDETGRKKMNNKLGLQVPTNITNLTIDDFTKIFEKIKRKSLKNFSSDDIDDLQNKRIRGVGDLLNSELFDGQNPILESLKLEPEKLDDKRYDDSYQYKQLLYRLGLEEERKIDEKKILRFTKNFIRNKVNELFNYCKLSQFLDQTNPLAQIAHARRISALGPGGVSGDQVSSSLRDLHPSYYGRICIIETPEGKKVGLTCSLANYGRVNSDGSVETPFFKVKKGCVLKSEPLIYLTSNEEENFKIAAADTPLTPGNQFKETFVAVKFQKKISDMLPDDVEGMHVSPLQLFAPALTLIPFFEHNDAIRTLMGGNMQRQALPLMFPSRPIVATPLDVQLMETGRLNCISKCYGQVLSADNQVISILENRSKRKIKHYLKKYIRSNQGTCITQKLCVWPGEYVKKGQLLADGPASDRGSIALGQNLLVAYAPWDGYNYEDSILINQRLADEDVLTSIHLHEAGIKIEIPETGILTNIIPNITDREQSQLDRFGFIKEGAFIKPDDIIIGIQQSGLGIVPDTAEGRLIRDILRLEEVPTYVDGSIRASDQINGKVLHRKFKNGYLHLCFAEVLPIQMGDKLAGRHGNKGVISGVMRPEDMPFLPDGTPIDIMLSPLGVPSRMNIGQLFEGILGFAGQMSGKKYRIKPFDEQYGAETSNLIVNGQLRQARNLSGKHWVYNTSAIGKTFLRDGRTGETFDNAVTVCNTYILKLLHVVAHKIHARCNGPYSAITQQPLKGKANRGGQRFGEMEVWALEAFGASYNLQELLTLKSDDMFGRVRFYLDTVLNNNSYLENPGTPEAFKVLMTELRGLGINIETYNMENKRTLVLNQVSDDPFEF